MVTVKAKIPKALKEQIWIKWIGKQFESKCTVRWCNNQITVFDWEAGHNIPESKGGHTNIGNLQPICSRCNKSMGNRYSISEWNELDENTILSATKTSTSVHKVSKKKPKTSREHTLLQKIFPCLY